MNYRRLGSSGLKVSELSLGSWVTFGNQLDQQKAAELIHAAYDHGVNYFDNADVYAMGQAETLMGQAITDLPRHELVISSKAFWPTQKGPNGCGLSRKHLTESLNGSLKRLGTDYVDLYFCHRFDPATPVLEVVQTMDNFVRQGKVLYWGTSEWRADQIAHAVGVAQAYHLIAPVMEQPMYNLFVRRKVELELYPVCRELGIGLTTFSPLFFGLLSGKYNDGIPAGSRASMEGDTETKEAITPQRIEKVRRLAALAQETGLTTAQLSIAYLLSHKEVSSVILGASRLSQLEQNLQASEAVAKLTPDVLDLLAAILGLAAAE